MCPIRHDDDFSVTTTKHSESTERNNLHRKDAVFTPGAPPQSHGPFGSVKICCNFYKVTLKRINGERQNLKTKARDLIRLNNYIIFCLRLLNNSLSSRVSEATALPARPLASYRFCLFL